jgi:outer membrane protein assembly factor BamD
MEYLTIKAQYLYSYHSSEFKQEQRYGQALGFVQSFLEKYPSSKYLNQTLALKRDCETGVARAKRILAEYASDEKYRRRFEKKDSVTNTQPSPIINTNQKIPK